MTSLPDLPITLVYLECACNYLSALPTLPASLNYVLGCGGNLLSSLPPLPPTLATLSCSNNLLTSLPTLPANIQYVDCSYNPNLTCLSGANHIGYLEWSNTNITCLPSSLIIGTANPSIGNMPLCAFSNTNNCPVFWNISGKTFVDTDSNCLADSNEVLLKNLKVNLYKDGVLNQQVFVNGLGQYSFNVDTGNYVYSIDITLLPLNIECPSSFSFTTHLTYANPQNPNKDFSFDCKSGFDVGATGVVRRLGGFRPGHVTTISFLAGDISNLYNKHCALGVSGTVTVVISGSANFFSIAPGALTPAVNGDTLIYAVTDFGTTDYQNDFSIVLQTDTNAQLNDQICFSVSVTPLIVDNNIENNNYNHCFSVHNSYQMRKKLAL